jgi:hypothetical protein
MRIFRIGLVVYTALLAPAWAQAKSPFEGRWNFNLTTPGGTRASWLGIAEKQGALEVMYQPTGGNVIQLKDVKVEGGKLILVINAASANRPATTWELEAKGKNLLAGTQKRGETATPLEGARAPELKRKEPKSWTKPEPIFNGKDLTGWEPIGNPANSHWTVQDGILVNAKLGANLKTTGKYEDFKVHFEVLLPEHTNSGFYLRGRYELQLELGSGEKTPPERRNGGIYGRIAPVNPPAAKPGEWDVYDVTLVGRTLTVVQNGVKTMDKVELEGITGGALDANEGEPGPFYIQGDHAGGVKFRNITISTPKK